MHGRILRVDIANYKKEIVCPIYDSSADISGQAFDVHIRYERNGWKELSFSIPTKCDTENGQEDNFRLDYIIADYRIRVITKKGVDWYVLSEDTVQHEAFSKNYTVTAGHISKFLKHRALDLEFSDEEGNNVGTAKELTKTVLENTDWNLGKVATFYEDDSATEKIRSLNAPVKTGAFRLIEMICELFEAKPVYEGDTQTVDILPMNPFSELQPGEIPEAVYPNAAEDQRFLIDSNVIELHYDKSIKNLNRTRNTDNIATRLYAYGAYGDYISKYCSVQTASHDEFTFDVKPSENEQEYQITDEDVVRYFTARDTGPSLNWSLLDFNSRRYVWDEKKRLAYHVYEDAKTKNYIVLKGTRESVVNYFPFLSDYTYYEKVGLLTEDMFQSVAAYQRDMAKYYKATIEAQEKINTSIEKLSTIGVPQSGYLKLDIDTKKSVSSSDGAVLYIRKDRYPDGIIYRSDYAEAEKNYFEWHVAQSLKANGDPTSGPASIIYQFKNTDPVQWKAVYLKDIDGRTHEDIDGNVIHDGYNYAISIGDKPTAITVWGELDISDDDTFYLFCRNSFSGKLGPKFADDEAAIQTLENETTMATIKHPTYFIDVNDDLPSIDFKTYGWCYRYNSQNYDEVGTLYFCWPERNDTQWRNVYFSDTEPFAVNTAYYYNTRYKTLWHGENGGWVHLNAIPDETDLAKNFGIVFLYARRRDQIYKGLYENYRYTTYSFLPVSNYAFYSPFGYYWLFTTDRNIESGSSIRLNTIEGCVYQDDNVEHIVSAKAYRYDTAIFTSSNDLAEATFSEGTVSTETGVENAENGYYKSNYISIWPNETYLCSLPRDSFALLYDSNRNYLSYIPNLGSAGSFSTAVSITYSSYADGMSAASFKQAKYMKLVVPEDAILGTKIKDNYYIQLDNYQSHFFVSDKKYQILSSVVPMEDTPVGINSLIKQFRDTSDLLYFELIPALKEAQDNIISSNAKQLHELGDVIREGWWQDSSYVDGDEQRMYNDALDNLRKIAQPEIKYSFEFLDLFFSNRDREYSVDELNEVEWPDIEITDAAHLIDPEIQVNQWAYIDVLDKYFDTPWKTIIEANTQLTLMGQHEFKDVMTRIAEVASETKAKQTVYKRAANISTTGTISGEAIEGSINTASVQMSGNGWKTNENGDMLLESGDGLAAMRFNGSGLFVASSKNSDGSWEWKQLGSGYGINGDLITSGSIEGSMVKLASISADRLNANVGSAIDIASNRALSLYATVDGSKPSGSLKTSDAIIEIKAGQTSDDKAAIDIASGGQINMSGADLNIKAKSEINVISGGGIYVHSDGVFQVDSGNFSIDGNGNVKMKGTVESESGEIGGWHIGTSHLGSADTLQASSIGLRPSANDDDVIFWAGKEVSGTSDFSSAGFKLKANGKVESKDIQISGCLSVDSSRNNLENIRAFDVESAKFDNLIPVSFTYKGSSDVHYGLVHDNVVQNYPDLCKENGAVEIMDFISVLIKEVQRVKTTQGADVSGLSDKIDEVKRLIASIDLAPITKDINDLKEAVDSINATFNTIADLTTNS